MVDSVPDFIAYTIGGAATGWACIIICMMKTGVDIGDSSKIGTLALHGTGVYICVSIAFSIVLSVKPDPDGLPPMWKFLALFHKTRERKTANEVEFDAGQYADVGTTPANAFEARMWSDVYEHGHAHLAKRRAEVEEETATYLDKVRARAEEAEKLHRAQVRRDGAREWMKKNDGQEEGD